MKYEEVRAVQHQTLLRQVFIFYSMCLYHLYRLSLCLEATVNQFFMELIINIITFQFGLNPLFPLSTHNYTHYRNLIYTGTVESSSLGCVWASGEFKVNCHLE